MFFYLIVMIKILNQVFFNFTCGKIIRRKKICAYYEKLRKDQIFFFYQNEIKTKIKTKSQSPPKAAAENFSNFDNLKMIFLLYFVDLTDQVESLWTSF